jgi:hypothetical protein
MSIIKQTLGDLIIKLAKQNLQVKLFVGSRDCLNDYGWHVRYYVEVLKTIEFCSKCREQFNVDYKEDFYPKHHQHSHRSELVTILCKEFMHEDDLCSALINIEP